MRILATTIIIRFTTFSSTAAGQGLAVAAAAAVVVVVAAALAEQVASLPLCLSTTVLLHQTLRPPSMLVSFLIPQKTLQLHNHRGNSTTKDEEKKMRIIPNYRVKIHLKSLPITNIPSHNLNLNLILSRPCQDHKTMPPQVKDLRIKCPMLCEVLLSHWPKNL